MIYSDDLLEVRERLDNWATHYKDRVAQRVTMSLEGRYKGEHSETNIIASLVDVNDAIVLEKAIISLPEKQRNIIKYAYLKRISIKDKPYTNFNVVCRKLGINQRDYEQEDKKAHYMVKNILNRMQS